MDGGSRGAADSEQVASESLARWYQAWNAHDVDAIGALVTDDVLYEDPSAPTAVMRGRAPVKQYAGAAFAGIPDLCLERLEEWVTPGLPPLAPTGLPIELFGMDRSEIRDGKLARHQIFWDMVELGRQIGAFPKGGRARRGSRVLAPFAATHCTQDATALDAFGLRYRTAHPSSSVHSRPVEFVSRRELSASALANARVRLLTVQRTPAGLGFPVSSIH
jgi:SnoaL-like domain